MKEVSSVYISVIDLSLLYSLWKVVLENESCPVVVQSLQRAQVQRTCMSGSEARGQINEVGDVWDGKQTSTIKERHQPTNPARSFIP